MGKGAADREQRGNCTGDLPQVTVQGSGRTDNAPRVSRLQAQGSALQGVLPPLVHKNAREKAFQEKPFLRASMTSPLAPGTCLSPFLVGRVKPGGWEVAGGKMGGGGGGGGVILLAG